MSRAGCNLSGVPGAWALLAGLGLLAVGIGGCFHSDPQPVRTDRVVIPGAWVFEPEVAQVEVGTTVTWVNNGGQPHTVSFEAFGFDEVLEPGGTTEYTFDETGTFDYECRYHRPDMVAKVSVLEQDATDADGPA